MSVLIQFLTQIRTQVRHSQSEKLASWLQIAPEAGQQYHQLAAELRSKTSDELDVAVITCLPEDDEHLADGEYAPWASFNAFIKDYLLFWRDVDYQDLVGAHELLSTVVNSCATAFSNPQGGMLLQTSQSLSTTLANLTMTLSKRPDLLRRVKRGASAGDDGPNSLAERSAETIQKIFRTCLQDRTTDRTSTPGGLKVAVYTFANLVLKLLFACRRTQLATMLLNQIESQAPLLSLYPAAQRVTFLYYLGRYWFSNNHFLRAANCLQEAYQQAPHHPQCIPHRTKILTYLIPCNILLGRYPSMKLLNKPECESLRTVFSPLCVCIRAGDFVGFQSHLLKHEDWLFERGVLIPLTHKLRPQLWRSLARKTFLLTYEPPVDASSRKAATLNLVDLYTVAVYVQRRLEGWLPSNPMHKPSSSVNKLLYKSIKNATVPVPEDTTLSPPPGGVKKLRPNEGLVWGNKSITFEDVELMVAELVHQGLMHGFVAHGQGRFAIIGAKAKGPVVAGWPSVWPAIKGRYEGDVDYDNAPGWVRGIRP